VSLLLREVESLMRRPLLQLKCLSYCKYGNYALPFLINLEGSDAVVDLKGDLLSTDLVSEIYLRVCLLLLRQLLKRDELPISQKLNCILKTQVALTRMARNYNYRLALLRLTKFIASS